MTQHELSQSIFYHAWLHWRIETNWIKNHNESIQDKISSDLLRELNEKQLLRIPDSIGMGISTV